MSQIRRILIVLRIIMQALLTRDFCLHPNTTHTTLSSLFLLFIITTMESDSSSYSSSNNNNSPPYIPPIKRSGSQYVNDEHTHKNFCWHTEGKQPVVWRKNQKKYIKLYYRCSERKNGCMAKKAIHQVPGEPIASYSHFHNHPPIYNTQEKEEENRIAPESM